MTSQERYALLAALMPLTDPLMNQGDIESDFDLSLAFGKKLIHFLRLKPDANHTYFTNAGPKTEIGVARLALNLLVNTLAGDEEEDEA
jgi:hypothetical protein